MVKNKFSKQQRRSVVALLASLVVVVILMVVASLSQGNGAQNNTASPIEGPIKIKGTVMCLPHKDTSGPQTMECAFGIKDESGRYFGMKDSDPGYKNINGLPMNIKVEVVGTFKKELSALYPTVGVIEITKIER